MADDTTRIINLTEATEIADGMYLVTDASTGTRKLSLQKVLDKAGGNVADDYDATATYEVGDLCVYKGVLYECTTAITTAEAWNSAHWSRINLGDIVADIDGSIEELYEDKANESGEYDDIVAGTAKQLLSSIYTTNDSPYLYRPTPADSDRERVKRLEGLSVGWNQLIDSSHFINNTSGDVTVTPNDDGSITVVVANTLSSDVTIQLTNNNSVGYFRVPVGHNFVIYDENTRFSNCDYREGYSGTSLGWNTIKTKVTNDIIFLGLKLFSGTPSGTYKIRPRVIDLTTLFGSTIADYIYSLEQATAGSGVAWVKQYIDLDSYHAYSAPTIKSVEGLEAHVMRDADDNIIGNYPLDSTITLRGVGKLVDGKLVADGDWYEPSGKKTVRYGERAYQSGDESLADAITDGTTTVYKLTTPTTSTASPYSEVQICESGGTEEFVTDGVVPVGNVTEYTADLRRQVENIYGIPPVPTEDGEYTLHATVAEGVKTFTWESEV